jgi:hypothetical protein
VSRLHAKRTQSRPAHDIVARGAGTGHWSEGGCKADERDAPLGGFQIARSARLPQVHAAACMHNSQLIQELVRLAHALHPVIGRVVVGAVHQIEAHRFQIVRGLGRSELPIAAVLHLGPTLELR